MLAIKAKSSKNYMNQLLAGTAFDPFLLIEGTLSTAITYTFDGHINHDFFPENERGAEMLPYEFMPWSELKPNIYNLVKGINPPLYMKLVMQLKPDKMQQLLQKAAPDTDFSSLKSLIITLKYDAEGVIITTGTSYHTFVPSHEADILWDNSIRHYLSGLNLDFEEY